ncbi:MAG: phosphoglycolate phosphatase [Thermoplasmata archaeon]
MAARPLRAIVTDIDGTLTDARRRLNTEVVERLRALEDRGIPVILATGNVLPIALALHRSIGLSGPIVAENGGVLFREVDGAGTIERLSDRAVAWAAFQRLRRAGLPVRRLYTDRWRESEVALEANVAVSRLRPHLKGLNVRVEGTGFALHLMERGAGKLPALRRALRGVGLSLADCLVAGDGDNDVAMLRHAGYAVSFPTASARARRAADFIAHGPSADGFCEVLKLPGVVARLVPQAARSDVGR